MPKDRLNMSQLKSAPVIRGLAIRALQVGLILMLVGAGWLIYRQLPANHY